MTGLKCHGYIRHGIFIIHVCHTVLPIETLSPIIRYRYPTIPLPFIFGHILLMTCYVVSLLSALYFVAVATVAALVGQYVVRKMISLFRRASLIIFVLAFIIFISAIFLGKWKCWTDIHGFYTAFKSSILPNEPVLKSSLWQVWLA